MLKFVKWFCYLVYYTDICITIKTNKVMKVENEKIVSVSKSDLNHLLINLEAKVEKFDSCNAWGFGGAVGNRYHLKNNIVVTIATACYRHLPSHDFIRVDHNGKHGVIDEDTTPTQLAKVYNFIIKNI